MSEGRATEVGEVRKLIDTILAKILSVAKDWSPKSSDHDSSFEECEAFILEIEMKKVLSYKGFS